MEEKDEQQCGDGALVKLYSETEQEIAPRKQIVRYRDA